MTAIIVIGKSGYGITVPMIICFIHGLAVVWVGGGVGWFLLISNVLEGLLNLLLNFGYLECLILIC